MPNEPAPTSLSGAEPPVQSTEQVEPTILEPITNTVTASINAKTESLSSYIVDFVDGLGLPVWAESIVSGAVLLLALAVLAFLIFFVVRPFALRIFTGIIRRTTTSWDDALVQYGIAKWISHFISALLINILIPGLFRDTPEIGETLTKLGRLYLVISGLLVFNAFLNVGRKLFVKTRDTHNLPATSLVQVLKLLACLVAVILFVSVLIGESPLAFLGGLGVFTSVIMLVFKDAILGFAAGIQLTSNNMIKEGDWIEMPKHGADGNVQEVGLTTVKVMNFDKTITTIPTYALISESFKNWRSMPKSGGRRIKRSIYIDLKTVKFCDSKMIDRYRNIQYISGYLDERLREIRKFNSKSKLDSTKSPVNGRRLTNIGTFRAYIEAYLRNHPNIHQDGMTLIVRQLDSGPNGVPIEIYCFSNIVTWSEYEVIQSDIFDHIFAIAGEFDLKIFQNPTELTFTGYGPGPR
ncbi:MAG: mechanosensitive ion channel [Verrucomicrobiales bacterium]|nr:mechanosensitive ion channel [Verrucomicrobiales bacterium]